MSAATDQVFPTGVGVNRMPVIRLRRLTRIPHRRGGEPQMALLNITNRTYSPQAWG